MAIQNRVVDIQQYTSWCQRYMKICMSFEVSCLLQHDEAEAQRPAKYCQDTVCLRSKVCISVGTGDGTDALHAVHCL